MAVEATAPVVQSETSSVGSVVDNRQIQTMPLNGRSNILNLIAYLRQQTGKTFIIATHDPVVASHADRSIRLMDGLIASIDTVGGKNTQ